jgi:uncharacterized protein (TIGR03067 family)
MLPQFSISILITCYLLAIGNLATGQDSGRGKGVKRDVEMLQGQWKLVRCEVDGSTLDIGAAKLIIKHNSYMLHLEYGTDKGTFSVNFLAKPKRCDFQSDDSGELCHAVYDLNANLLKVAYRFDNKRPTSIVGKVESEEGHVLYIFEREDGNREKP